MPQCLAGYDLFHAKQPINRAKPCTTTSSSPMFIGAEYKKWSSQSRWNKRRAIGLSGRIEESSYQKIRFEVFYLSSTYGGTFTTGRSQNTIRNRWRIHVGLLWAFASNWNTGGNTILPKLNGTKKCNSEKWEFEEFCRAKPTFKSGQYLTIC